jgi:hypothetical protein
MHGTLRRQHIGRPARARRLREISKETHGILLKAHTGDGETEAFTIDFASIEFNYNPIAEDELEEMLQSVFKAIGMGRAVSRAAPP